MTVYEEDVDEFLEHFGVRGMKWGVRRELNRQLKVERKRRTKEQQKQAVTIAREKVLGGTVRRQRKEAFRQFRIDKKTLGREKALKILNKKKNKSYKTVAVANQYKSGKERAGVILGVAGALTLSAIAAAGKASA